jgi:hypothetical protein
MRMLSSAPPDVIIEFDAQIPINSYVTDCTADGSRAKIFATMSGMLNIGLASGPWVSSNPRTD